jgi:AcrR family transcriptional regulator
MESSRFLGRRASRETRRKQLIEATIAVIARKGLSNLTMTDIAVTAGVSHGLVNFHFQSKERLLADTLRLMSEEHRQGWEASITDAGPDPAEQLNALIIGEFENGNQSPERLTAWCAFWGDAPNRPVYLDHCGENERAYAEVFELICGKLSATGGYERDPVRAARIMRLAIEGMCLELMFSANPYGQDEALSTAFCCAAALFPRHFTADGLIRR